MGRWTLGRSRISLLAMSVIAVAACGSTTAVPSASPSGPNQNANEPMGGTLNLGIWTEPTSFLDAGIIGNLAFSKLVDAPVAEGLLWYRSVDQTANAHTLADYYQPWLATEIPTTANGDVKTRGCADPAAKMCVTWKLRSGVQWDDGSTFSSHDVCDTYQFFYLKYQDQNPTAVLSTDGWDQVIDCTATDAHTAVVSFKTTYAPYLSLGSGVYGVLPASILDKAFAAGASSPGHSGANLEQFQNVFDLTVGSHAPDAFRGTATLDLAIDGTGPYVFQRYIPGQEIDLVRNQNYWNKAHLPHIERLVFKIEADVPAEITAAEDGDIDMGFDYQLGDLTTMLNAEQEGKLTVQTVPDSGAEHIDMNMCANAHGLCGPQAQQSPYTADPAIRKAMLMAIDRQQIIDVEADHETIIPHDAWQYLGVAYALDPETNPQTQFDPAGAQALLDSRGYRLSPNCDGGQTRAYSDGSCIDIDLGTTSDDAAGVATELLIQSDLGKIGIHVNVPFVPNLDSTAFFGSFASGGPLYTHNFDMAMYSSDVSPGEFDGYASTYHGDCGDSCPAENQIPSASNGGQGQNFTGEDDPALDTALDAEHSTVDLKTRATDDQMAEELIAHDLPDLPLYQEITVNSATTQLHGLLLNDIVWDYNAYDWYCTAGNCQANQ